MSFDPTELELVFAAKDGKIYNFPGLKPCGMKAGKFFSLDNTFLLKLPNYSELFMLPGRMPVGFEPDTGETIALEHDPYSEKDEPCYAVAAFIPPGHTLTYSTAYKEVEGAPLLPLFAYGTCVYYRGDFYVAAYKVDEDIRHDERFMDQRKIEEGVEERKKLFPQNRLVPHLANCALVNGCANAKNFFLGRFEAPIPTSPVCNAQCQGCISLQPPNRIPSTQIRISFIPEAEEIAELVLYHFEKEEKPIVSFGQGCEGEPSLSVDVIEKAIRLIRQKTSKGVLNMNSNASLPKNLERLFAVGLNQIRVSTNSVREPYYSRYYQPKNYSFKDVTESIRMAKKYKAFVSLNYLSMPGFTDTRGEYEALQNFIREERIDMIQWRNLNYDPMQYFRDLEIWPGVDEILDMKQVIKSLKKEFVNLRMGYFNPVTQ